MRQWLELSDGHDRLDPLYKFVCKIKFVLASIGAHATAASPPFGILEYENELGCTPP
jgi:hypothetical protein